MGSLLAALQSGRIRSYASWVVFGSVVLIVVMAVLGAGQ
jgi:hypothetical protein